MGFITKFKNHGVTFERDGNKPKSKDKKKRKRIYRMKKKSKQINHKRNK